MQPMPAAFSQMQRKALSRKNQCFPEETTMTVANRVFNFFVDSVDSVDFVRQTVYRNKQLLTATCCIISGE